MATPPPEGRLTTWRPTSSPAVRAGTPSTSASMGTEHPVFAGVHQGFGPWRSFGVLIRTFATMRPQHPGVRLRLIGAGYGPSVQSASWARARFNRRSIDFLRHNRARSGVGDPSEHAG